MTTIIWSPSAQNDLATLDDEFAQLNPAHGFRVGQAALAASRFLADFPRAGPTIDGPVRKWRVRATDYVIPYRIVDDGIEIVRLHHARADWRPVSS